MTEEIRNKLYELSEEKYREFNQKLLPGVKHVLGVRLPILRKLAKEIAKDDFRVYLAEAQAQITRDSIHEEIMVQGLLSDMRRWSRKSTGNVLTSSFLR